MFVTQSQYENMGKEQLTQELTDINSSYVNNINVKLTDLSEKFNEFTLKYNKVYSSCSNIKALTLIYSPRSFSWSVMLLQILSIVEERQLNSTLCLQNYMKMFWRKVFVSGSQ